MLNNLIFGYDITHIVGNVFYVVLGMIVFHVLTGLLVAGKERKINSSINLEGLIRKLGIIIGLTFITFADVYFKADGVITKIGVGLLVAYEGLSIIENFSRIGIDFKFLTKYFDKNKVKKEG